MTRPARRRAGGRERFASARTREGEERERASERRGTCGESLLPFLSLLLASLLLLLLPRDTNDTQRFSVGREKQIGARVALGKKKHLPIFFLISATRRRRRLHSDPSSRFFSSFQPNTLFSLFLPVRNHPYSNLHSLQQWFPAPPSSPSASWRSPALPPLPATSSERREDTPTRRARPRRSRPSR